MSVTVVSCVYGDYFRFVSTWTESLDQLERKPDAIRTSVGHPSAPCPWLYAQAWHLQQAIGAVETDWVWILDIDDIALPDALNGIDDVEADVWAMGYERSDGEVYIPPPLTAREVLASPRNLIPAGSAIRTKAFRECGGFHDIAFQDWGLWRSLADHGATFETSGRAHYRYNRHPGTRSETELTREARLKHMAEMEDAELARYAADSKRFADYFRETHAQPV